MNSEDLENIAEFKREKLAQKNHRDYQRYKPFPFRLAELKAKMQFDAFNNPQELGSTVHAVGLAIIRNYYYKREVFRDTQLQKLIELAKERRCYKPPVYKKYGDLDCQPKLFYDD